MVVYGRTRNPGPIDPLGMPTYESVVMSFNPVGFWPMNDSSGTTMTALAGSNGTYVNGPTLGVGGPTPLIGSGVQFDGTNDYASAPLDLSSYSAVTVSGWMFIPTGASNDKVPLEHTSNWNANPTFGWFPMWNNGYWGVVTTGTADPAVRNIGVTRPSFNAWHHYVTQHPRNGSYPSIWIDGSKITSIPHTVSSGTVSGNFTNSTLYFGARGGSTAFVNYKMAQVAVFGSLLSDTECASLYAAGF